MSSHLSLYNKSTYRGLATDATQDVCLDVKLNDLFVGMMYKMSIEMDTITNLPHIQHTRYHSNEGVLLLVIPLYNLFNNSFLN